MRDAAGEWMDKQFLVELAAVILKDRRRRPAWMPYVGERCEFHIHDKKNPRCPGSN
jgi:hypothetical protein